MNKNKFLVILVTFVVLVGSILLFVNTVTVASVNTQSGYSFRHPILYRVTKVELGQTPPFTEIELRGRINNKVVATLRSTPKSLTTLENEVEIALLNEGSTKTELTKNEVKIVLVESDFFGTPAKMAFWETPDSVVRLFSSSSASVFDRVLETILVL